MTIGHTLVGAGRRKVLVLHGWFGDHTVFEPTFRSLDLDRFTYAFVDYRGYGKSREMTGKYTMREIAADALELIEELGWETFHLVGHSMGAMAMQRVMLDIDARGRVRSAIGIAPVPACGGQLDDEARELFSGAVASDDNRYAILDFTTGNRNCARWLRHMVRRSRETTTEEAFAGYLEAWTGEDFAAEVQEAGIATPLRVLLGEHDLAFTREAMASTYLAWYTRGDLEMIGNAGHYPMQETPVQLATRIEAFLSDHE
ncbi:MAG: alpha/beta hydrolase [Gammaproteobacteria bacterium]|nr:alpha/beta hydrolase [Gammaproteobacteria bacterium]